MTCGRYCRIRRRQIIVLSGWRMQQLFDSGQLLVVRDIPWNVCAQSPTTNKIHLILKIIQIHVLHIFRIIDIFISVAGSGQNMMPIPIGQKGRKCYRKPYAIVDRYGGKDGFVHFLMYIKRIFIICMNIKNLTIIND